MEHSVAPHEQTVSISGGCDRTVYGYSKTSNRNPALPDPRHKRRGPPRVESQMKRGQYPPYYSAVPSASRCRDMNCASPTQAVGESFRGWGIYRRNLRHHACGIRSRATGSPYAMKTECVSRFLASFHVPLLRIPCHCSDSALRSLQ